MTLTKTFYIKVYPNDQFPAISISPEKYSYLDSALGKSSQNILRQLKLIKNLKDKDEYIEKDDNGFMELKIRKDYIYMRSPLDIFKPLKVSTNQFVSLLMEWYYFVLKYEQGEMPFIIPPTKRDEWMVVRRSDMKEIKWDKEKFYADENIFIEKIEKWFNSTDK